MLFGDAMAGETEECISFQADCLPTGSISFGRFELEPLAWERRSSFSHNRYLEEVEKYSTPGSVTQKRAILEAHFKKKPLLLPQSSLENSYESGCQTTENGSNHHRSYEDEFEDHEDRGDAEFDRYHELSNSSDQQGVIEYEQEVVSVPKSVADPTPCNDEKIVDSTSASDNKVLQQQSECSSVLSIKDELCIVAEEEPDNKAVIVEELIEKKEAVNLEALVEKRDISSESTLAKPKRVLDSKKKTETTPFRVKGVEQKTTPMKSKSQLPSQSLRKPSVEGGHKHPSKTLTKSMQKEEREDASRNKSEKELPWRSPKPSISSSTNLETSVNMRAKVRQGNRSVQGVKAKKEAVAPHSSSGRREMEVRTPANRPKEATDSPEKEESTQNGSVFSFKSDERAEKRKEYFMKLEEKLHAKEAEMSEIQARTQEETEVALRQFRRSLNFKATPMPSFYHEAAPRVSQGKKKVATPANTQNLQTKCARPRSRHSQEKSASIVSKGPSVEIQPCSAHNHAPASAKSIESGKKAERNVQNSINNSSRKKGESVSRVRRGEGNAVCRQSTTAVHVAT